MNGDDADADLGDGAAWAGGSRWPRHRRRNHQRVQACEWLFRQLVDRTDAVRGSSRSSPAPGGDWAVQIGGDGVSLMKP